MLKIVIALETSSSWEEAMAPVNRMRFVSIIRMGRWVDVENMDEK